VGAMRAAPLLLYDGTCGFCAATVQFILRHERQHVLRFAALESRTGRQIRARHPRVGTADSMIWVEHPGDTNERVVDRSAAALRIARYLGGPWRLVLLAAVIPRLVRDPFYDFVARRRHQLVDEHVQCRVPSPEVRRRFVDLSLGDAE
jgi:predicted DCC family thiol-disulfide oxidoreductase YuxK